MKKDIFLAEIRKLLAENKQTNKDVQACKCLINKHFANLLACKFSRFACRNQLFAR
ncbi:MAG: hypothetical protein HUK14_08925 [Muribaculaceae bacterium]|nr:hypothetical protein [Muribaculaceae bacterium]